MSNNNFKNSYDRALFAYYILRRLGAGRVNSFSERLRSQKLQYFAQLLKVSSYYSFNLYLYGPYSPDLAHDLFEIKKRGDRVKLDKLIPLELEKRFRRLQSFVRGKTIKELEFIATLHWLLKIGHFSEVEAKNKLIEWKGASSDEIKYAFSALKTI